MEIIISINEQSKVDEIISMLKSTQFVEILKIKKPAKQLLPNNETLTTFMQSEAGVGLTKFDSTESLFNHLGI